MAAKKKAQRGGRRHGLTPSGESPQRRYRTSPEAEDDLEALVEAWGDTNRSRVTRRALRVARETIQGAPTGKRRRDDEAMSGGWVRLDLLEAVSLRSELEQVKRERDALAAAMEAVREAAHDRKGACHECFALSGRDTVQGLEPIEPHDWDRSLGRALDTGLAAHLSERDARVRGEALEEAARVCDERGAAIHRPNDWESGYMRGARSCARAIRSLSPMTPKEEPPPAPTDRETPRVCSCSFNPGEVRSVLDVAPHGLCGRCRLPLR